MRKRMNGDGGPGEKEAETVRTTETADRNTTAGGKRETTAGKMTEETPMERIAANPGADRIGRHPGS